LDILSQLIEAEIQRRVNSLLPATPFGVWLNGVGWLRSSDGLHVVSDRRRELMESVANLCGHGARVLPIDDALTEQELRDLERQILGRQQAERARTMPERIRKWWYGLFRQTQ